jgi:hypothetical protein
MNKLLGFAAVTFLGLSAQAYAGDVQVDVTGYSCSLNSTTTDHAASQSATCATQPNLPSVRFDQKGYSLYVGQGAVGASTSLAGNDSLHLGVAGSNNSLRTHDASGTHQGDQNSVGLFLQERASCGEYTASTSRSTATGADAAASASLDAKVWLPLAGSNWKTYLGLGASFSAAGDDQANAKTYTGAAAVGVRASL